MKTTQTLLHALPVELLSWVEKWITDRELRAAVLRIHPGFSVVEIRSQDELRAEVSGGRVPFRVCLALSLFDVSVRTLHEFMVKNVCECTVDIGAMNDQGLKESAISTSSDEPVQSKFWASALKEIKGITRAGMWAVSPHTGARTFLKNNRYTEGAESFAASGGKLLPLAGWNFFEIDRHRRG